MAERRNPYFILGLDYGASPEQARAAFARLSRRLRREPGAPYQLEDATWALHEIEHATDTGADLDVYRVPANPDAYTYRPDRGVLALAPQHLPRRTGSSAADVTRLQAEVADQLGAAALSAAVDAWEAPAPSAADHPSAADWAPDPAPDPSPAAETPAGAGAAGAPTAAGVGGARRSDPVAVALGNATGLGLGYLLLRRWGGAGLTLAVTAVVVSIIAAFAQPGWFWRVVALLWWVFMIIHGWRLAAGPRRQAWRQRAVAAGAAMALVAGMVAVAVDARRLGAGAADAHAAGDCAETAATLERVGGRHRAVDPYVTRRTGGDAEACEMLLAAQAENDPAAAAGSLARYLDHPAARWDGAAQLRADLLLRAAEGELTASLVGDPDSLAAGFDLLAEVLAEAPTRDEAVRDLLTEYVAQLPDAEPCDAMSNLDWLAAREPSGDELDRAGDQADEIAPPVLAACGDELLEQDAQSALRVYETLLDRYPDHELAGAGREGVDAAETVLEGERVGQLLSGSEPRYCGSPEPYRGASPYSGAGPHPVLVLGSGTFRDALSGDWLGDDHTDASLILCVDGPSDGNVLQTCHYDAGAAFPGSSYAVELRANEYQVEAYEVHTGELAFERTVQTSSGGCPQVLEWTCPGLVPNCSPPGSIRAGHSDGPIRSAVQSWVFP